MTRESLRPLPVLTPERELPTGEALEALRRAKMASGYSGLIQPALALHGSPQPILAVGSRPGWLTEYQYVESWNDHEALVHALQAILVWDDGTALGDEDLLSRWTKVKVTRIGTEYD